MGGVQAEKGRARASPRFTSRPARRFRSRPAPSRRSGWALKAVPVAHRHRPAAAAHAKLSRPARAPPHGGDGPWRHQVRPCPIVTAIDALSSFLRNGRGSGNQTMRARRPGVPPARAGADPAPSSRLSAPRRVPRARRQAWRRRLTAALRRARAATGSGAAMGALGAGPTAISAAGSSGSCHSSRRTRRAGDSWSSESVRASCRCCAAAAARADPTTMKSLPPRQSTRRRSERVPRPLWCIASRSARHPVNRSPAGNAASRRDRSPHPRKDAPISTASPSTPASALQPAIGAVSSSSAATSCVRRSPMRGWPQSSSRSRNHTWAELVKRVFLLDVLRCLGPTESASARGPPDPSPATGPVADQTHHAISLRLVLD